jgi:uncharacterized 2Fe-2S/4Fe-4S cluster protein (DUF4445 family)
MGEFVVEGYDRRTGLIIGRTLLEHILELGIDINASCGGVGDCKQCLVRVSDADSLIPLTDAEREFIREEEYRLACQAKVIQDDEDIYVVIPERKFTIWVTGKRKEVELDPFVKAIPLYGNRVHWQTRDLGIYRGELYGIALDIGTTTLSMYCVDLETGKDVLVLSRENPQIKYGNDVVLRITYARNKGQAELEQDIRRGVNEMIRSLPINPEHIYEMTVVGNSTMRELFFGNPVETLGEAPYEPHSKLPVYRTAGELGLSINPRAIVYGLPLISGFIGADNVGVILATELHKGTETSMAIDIGTNTEIVIGNEERLIATSCASGPAFEGVGITWGIGGVGGAIKNMSIDEGLDVHYETINDLSPIGICGSGLIDALAQMLDRGVVDWRGRFTDNREEFVIVDRTNPITISEEDIDKLKLAKAAIALGIKVMMERYDIDLGMLDTLHLAGGFGNFINVENARKIGMLPNLPPEKIDRVGNAAIEGAREVLISRIKRREAETLARRVEHLSLASLTNFSYRYMNEFPFKRYQPS